MTLMVHLGTLTSTQVDHFLSACEGYESSIVGYFSKFGSDRLKIKRTVHCSDVWAGEVMAILIISSNPLLVEAISETLSRSLRSKLHSALPEDALLCIQEVHPRVILVDNAIPPALLGKILVYAQSLRTSHLILLNNSSNDFIFLDSYQANIDTVEDLVRVIQDRELANGNYRSENEHA